MGKVQGASQSSFTFCPLSQQDYSEELLERVVLLWEVLSLKLKQVRKRLNKVKFWWKLQDAQYKKTSIRHLTVLHWFLLRCSVISLTVCIISQWAVLTLFPVM